jgi:hypothetical protein
MDDSKMTWVIGASSIFGYGTMMSDVRVTLNDGSERDLVQKACAVGRYIVAGFAGSVQIGFQMLESLTKFLVPPDAAQPGAWEPEWVAERWKPIASKLFASAPPAEQALRCQILLVGVSHKIDLEAAANPRAVQMPRACIIRFSSPDFDFVLQNRRLSIEHIGSGGGVEHYTKTMQKYFELNSESLKAEMGTLGMWPKMLGSNVARLVAERPIGGVSPHVHILVCASGQIFTMTNDETRFPSKEGEPIEFKMPKVARSYQEFRLRCRSTGVAAEGAVA